MRFCITDNVVREISAVQTVRVTFAAMDLLLGAVIIQHNHQNKQ